MKYLTILILLFFLPEMADRSNGKPLSISDFSYQAYDRGHAYMNLLKTKIPGYGKQPSSIIYSTMNKLVEQSEKDGLIEWAAGRLSKHVLSLQGNMGEMLLNHAKRYVLRKYASANPFNCPGISKIVEGVPHSLTRNPKARLTIAHQSENQRAYLQCIADFIELYAAISCFDQVLEGSREIKPKWVPLPEDHVLFNPGPMVIRAAYELRIFFAIWDIQMDAKSIVELENASPEAKETTGYHTTDPPEDDSENEGDSEEEGAGEEEEAETSNSEGEDTETESESEDAGYMEAEEEASDKKVARRIDQAVPDLSLVDDRHAAFIEAVEEFLDSTKRRNEADPNSDSEVPTAASRHPRPCLCKYDLSHMTSPTK